MGFTDRIRRVFSRSPKPFPELPEVTLRPIGVVRSPIKETSQLGDASQIDSRVVIRPEMQEALLGLKEWSHVLVLFWPHRVPDESAALSHSSARAMTPRTLCRASLQRALRSATTRFSALPCGFSVSKATSSGCAGSTQSTAPPSSISSRTSHASIPCPTRRCRNGSRGASSRTAARRLRTLACETPLLNE